MTENTKKRPDHIAYAVRPQSGNAGPKYTRIGVAFATKNGGFTILYDALPYDRQIVLLEYGQDEKPVAISYGAPTRKPDFEVSMVRDGSGDSAYWTEVGAAYQQDGYLSVFLEVAPTGGKIVLSPPRENS